MHWKEAYQQKLCTASEAVSAGIHSGDRVVFGHGACEPEILVKAMIDNKAAYSDITVSQMVSASPAATTLPENSDVFRYEGWFTGAYATKAIQEGRADYVPIFFHEIPKMIRSGVFRVDVAMITVSRPDEHGYVSLGVSSDYTMQAVKSARTVIAEVNDQCPYTYGETFIPVEELDYIVETSRPLPEMPPVPVTPVAEAVAKNVASLIKDGDNLQLGIGAIPEATLAQLGDRKHLGIHSEMISDGVVDLYNKGAIDCSRKTLDNGKMVIGFIIGTKKLYDFADHNPAIELRQIDYVNHPEVVAQLNDMVCINSCVQVDLLGQIASESIGPKLISGVGGQVDFVRGARDSHDGKGRAIIAMPSVLEKKDGTRISKIVPELDEGAAVTTSRNDADYLITEYGIAHLTGRTMRDRARLLIGIAHPDFREGLIKSFEERFKTKY
ncbi:MAG: acetyl-CoA hydrolase/transferase C-terminal domain-containing protein [Eubacteriales bacterium]|nr:acetyl-CoA hydrolase/transferase C-terminal domain-containing protein [Eubacteriales bacterium]